MSFVRTLSVSVLMLMLTACASSFKTPYGSGHYASSPVQCVPYARQASGVNIRGDAHTWWDQADANYMRGQYPMPGSVLVLAQTNRMTHGHLAVVKNIVNSREIDVTHSNWGSDRKNRRIIYEAVRARDVSQMNDWSQISFWNYGSKGFGYPYAAKGFIYAKQ